MKSEITDIFPAEEKTYHYQEISSIQSSENPDKNINRIIAGQISSLELKPFPARKMAAVAENTISAIQSVKKGLSIFFNNFLHADMAELIEKRSETVIPESMMYNNDICPPPSFNDDPVYYYSAINVLILTTEACLDNFRLAMLYADKNIRQKTHPAYVAISVAAGLDEIGLKKLISDNSKSIRVASELIILLKSAAEKKLDELSGLFPDNFPQIRRIQSYLAIMSADNSEAGLREKNFPGHGPENEPESVHILSGFFNKSLHRLYKLPRHSTAYSQSISALMQLKERLLTFSKSGQNTIDYLSLIHDITPAIKTLSKCGNRAMSDVSGQIRNEYISVMMRVNNTLMEATVAIDDCLLGLCCRPDLAEKNPLRKVAGLFDEFIQNQGYQFSQDKSFPYRYAVYWNRLKRLHNAETSVQVMISESFIQDSLSALHRQKEEKSLSTLSQTSGHPDDVELWAVPLLEHQINVLRNENEGFNFRIKEKKIILLEKLLNLLATFNEEKIPGKNIILLAMAELRKTDHSDVHLLWNGRTGNIMRMLYKIHLTPEDCWNRIRQQIKDLEWRRIKTGSIRNGSASTQGRRVNALGELLSWITTPGIRIEQALISLREQMSGSFELLNKYDQALIDDLIWMDNQIPVDLWGKRLIDPEALPALLSHNPGKKNNNIFIIDEFIETLKQEISGSVFFNNSAKSHKISCLTALRDLLESGGTLYNALIKITDDQKKWPGSRWLYQGRTGELIQRLADEAYSSDEMTATPVIRNPGI